MVQPESDSSVNEVSDTDTASQSVGSGTVSGAPDTMTDEDLAEVPPKLSKWFTLDEWNHMSYYERMRTVNTLENYDILTGLGINVPKPDFMCTNPVKIPRIAMKKIPVHSTNKVRCTTAPRAGWNSPVQPIQMHITHTAADAADTCKPSNSGSDAELRNCSTNTEDNTIHIVIINMNTCSQQVHGKQDIKCKYLPKRNTEEANIWKTNKDGLETTKNNKVITSSLTSDGSKGKLEGLEGSRSYNESFSATSIFNRKDQIHTGDRPYKCTTCNKAFSQPSWLQRHERIHTGERPYKCTTCNKALSCTFSLHRHERMHTGEKRTFKCTICNKTFSYTSSLHRHVRMHLGKQSQKFAICNKALSQATDLQKLEQIHTMHPPYCNQELSDTSLLHTHE